MIRVLSTTLLVFGLCEGQQRSAELSCYECSARASNDTCTDEFRKTIKVNGFDQRCRVFEMNGKVVSQGVVPITLCSPRALNKVNKVRDALQLIGIGDVYPYCCNSDYCNKDMCSAMGLSRGNMLCTTTIESKLKEQTAIASGQLKINNDAELLSNNENFNGEGQQQTAIKSASFGGSQLIQRSSGVKTSANFLTILLFLPTCRECCDNLLFSAHTYSMIIKGFN